jgi:hypothetical protein
LIHIPVAIILFASSLVLFFLAFEERYGTFFILFFVVALLLLVPFVFVAYRAYALLRARYLLDRDGLQLNWGLRSESIPLPGIEWVKPVSQIAFELPLPRLSFPGAILGTVKTKDQGPVEFLASDIENLVLIATDTKIYAISPLKSIEFTKEYQSILELGSLAPIQPSSTLPAGFLRSVWNDIPARILFFSGLFCTLALLTFTSLAIPGRQMVTLGYDPSGAPLAAVPSIRLLILPSICIFLFAVDLISGLFFFRNPSQRIISYILWAASILTPLLLAIPLLLL